MNRIQRIFRDLRGQGGKALMPFLTAGDPDLSVTEQLLPAMQRAGAGIVELGFPFSDPIADGPVIQASMAHALAKGVRPRHVLDLVARQRAKLDLGLVAMVSYSIVHRLTPGSFIKDAGQAGIDGFIFPDLPLDEAGAVRDLVLKEGLTSSLLISPTTPAKRAEAIARACSGFVYVLARAGLTGERSEIPADLPEQLRRLRGVTDLPIAVGFGISDARQVAQVVAVADAVIVGSAIMRRVAARRDAEPDVLVCEVEAFVGGLARGLTDGMTNDETRNPNETRMTKSE